ncbi:unnamed protein product [Urochloa humidicola]
MLPKQPDVVPKGMKVGFVGSSMEAPGLSVDTRDCPHRQSSPPPRPSQSERSIAFKRWARGRCYRCLAHGHQVSSCRDYFRCIRCRRSGHRERHCPFRSPPARRVDSTVEPLQKQSWAAVVATPSLSACRSTLCADSVDKFKSSPTGSCEKDIDPICNNCGDSSTSTSLNPQSMVAPLVQLLRSELQHMIAIRLEEVVRPLREEVSAIKLWLARVVNHLECVVPPDMAELFGPCSPVHHSLAPSILTSIAGVCTSANSLVREDTCANTANSTITELPREMDPVTNEVAKKVLDSEFHQKTSVEHAIKLPCGTPQTCVSTEVAITETHPDLPMEQTSLQTITSVEDIVLVEDASDDEEDAIDACVTVEDPIFLITIEDNPTYSMVEVKAEEAPMIVDPPIEVKSSPSTKDTNGEDLGCPLIHPPAPSPPSTIARRRCKSYDRSSLRRSARLAHRSVLKDLGILGNDGKINENVIQDYATRLKELLPPKDLKPLMNLKGRAFLELLVELSLSLC